jgi:SAM-dependent methyltransferase
MIFQGYYEGFENDCVRGWVYNRSRPGEPVKVDIYANGIRLDTILADTYRPDLKEAGIGKGFHAFEHKIEGVHDASLIEIKVHGTEHALYRSAPQPNNCESDLSDRRVVRDRLSRQFIKGKGIEIGALHSPLSVARGTKVKYVDRLNKKELRSAYPEIHRREIVPVHVTDDGERLEKFNDGTLDFVIALHFLEHTQNPVFTFENMLRVLKTGGIAFIAIPDKRFTFDVERPVHGFEHLRRDYFEGPEWSRRRHYEEWIYHVDKLFGDQEIDILVDELIDQDYSIHFHVWTENEMHEMFLRMKEELNFPLDLVLMRPNKSEVVFILNRI